MRPRWDGEAEPLTHWLFRRLHAMGLIRVVVLFGGGRSWIAWRTDDNEAYPVGGHGYCRLEDNGSVWRNETGFPITGWCEP